MLSSTYKRYKLSNFMPNRGPSGTASGYFERTNKRSPYVKSGYMEEYEARASEGGLGYALLTFVCLAVLYPIGLVMLWSRRLRFSTSLKLLATFASAVIFCMLLVFAANVETDDPRIGSLQNRLNVAFDYSRCTWPAPPCPPWHRKWPARSRWCFRRRRRNTVSGRSPGPGQGSRSWKHEIPCQI